MGIKPISLPVLLAEPFNYPTYKYATVTTSRGNQKQYQLCQHALTPFFYAVSRIVSHEPLCTVTALHGLANMCGSRDHNLYVNL